MRGGSVARGGGDGVAGPDGCRAGSGRRKVSPDARQAFAAGPVVVGGVDHVDVAVRIVVDQTLEALHGVGVVAEAGAERAVLADAGHGAAAAGTATLGARVSGQSVAARKLAAALGAHVRPLARVQLRVALEVVQAAEAGLADIAQERLLVRMGEQV